MNLIAAVDSNWGIGKDGGLLFSIKQDMKFFRETTLNHVVVMGRKTLDSFPGGKALKNRTNIVLTRDNSFERENVTVTHSLEELLTELEKYDGDDIFVIGGAEIYRLLLPYCDRAYITKVSASKSADAFMANLDEAKDWSLAQSTKDFIDSDLLYKFCIYENQSKKTSE